MDLADLLYTQVIETSRIDLGKTCHPSHQKEEPMAKQQKDTENREERALARRGGGGLMSFEELDRWFDDVFRDFFSRRWLTPFFERGWPELRTPLEGKWPRVDVIDRDNEICVRAELPGISKENLDVSMSDNTVTIKASTRHEEKEEKGQFYRRELSRGEFQRTLILPTDVKGEEAKASFKDGILELIVPKLQQTERRTIKVE
jgi:HSP20 family protein